MSRVSYQIIFDWFDAASIREQVLVVVTGVSLIGFGFQLLVVDPLIATRDDVEKRVIKQQNVGKTLLRTLNQEPKGKRAYEQKVKELAVQMRRVSGMDVKLKALSSTLVAPNEMPLVLHSLISQSDMTLVSFENLPSQALIALENEQDQETSISRIGKPLQLYRHGITLKMEGSYANTLAYLQSIESQQWKFLWLSLHYEVVQFPMGRVQLKLETLSTESHWLGV